MDDFERKWQRISQLLSMEATGKERPVFSSGRTLFGIKSTAEEKMDLFAQEIEKEYAAKRKAVQKTKCESNNASQGQNESDTSHLYLASSGTSIRSSIEELTDRALKQAIRNARKKLDGNSQSE